MAAHTNAATSPRSASTRAALGALLVAIVFASFWPALSAEFLNYDDTALLTENRAWRGLDRERLAWMAQTNLMGHYMPLSWLSFGLDHALYGLTPPSYPEAGAYHATNVVLHALTALAVFALARRLFAIVSPAGNELRGSVFAALTACLWAVHPTRVESVVWLTERRDVLSALFFVLALIAWLGWARPTLGERRSVRSSALAAACAVLSAVALLAGLSFEDSRLLRIDSPATFAFGVALWFAAIASAMHGATPRHKLALIAAHAFALLSLLAKAWGIVLPALLVVLDAWPLRRWKRGEVLALVADKAAFAVLALVFARIALWAQQGAGALKSIGDHGVTERIAQAFFGLGYYPLKTIAPFGLQPIHELPAEIDLLHARWWLPVLGVSLFTAVALACVRRAPAVLASWLAFALCIAPVLGVAQSGLQLVADRYSHLASLPLILLAGGASLRASRRAPRIAAVAACALVTAAAFATHAYAKVWRDSLTLWEHTHARDPENAQAALSLGNSLLYSIDASTDPAAAKAACERALELYSSAYARTGDPLIAVNRSLALARLAEFEPARANELRAAAVEEARAALAAASEYGEFAPEYRMNYGTALVDAGRVEEGLEHLRWYAETRPDQVEGLRHLAHALLLSGQAGEAARFAKRALRLERGHTGTWLLLADALEGAGRRDEARAALGELLALDPAHTVARARLGLTP